MLRDKQAYDTLSALIFSLELDTFLVTYMAAGNIDVEYPNSKT